MKMAHEIIMPKLGLTMETGIIGKWLVSEGQEVAKDEPLVEITTEKLTNTVDSPDNGVLLKIVAKEGDELPVGGIIGYVGAAGEAVPDIAGTDKPDQEAAGEETKSTVTDTVKPAAENTENSRVKITPAAKALAKKLGIDFRGIIGTGPEGRITKEDIIAKSEEKAEKIPEKAAHEDINEMHTAPIAAASSSEIPYAGMRKAVGTSMSKSWGLAPKVTHQVFADVTDLLLLRSQLNANLHENDTKVTITDMLVKIVAKALKQMPLINSTLDGETIKLLKDINIGVAVSVENGLVVPVLPNTDKMDLFKVSSEIKRLSAKAREGKLTGIEMQGGTFTVSNIGSYDSVDFFTPIINQPESAILGVGRIRKMPVVNDDDSIEVRHMIGLSFAFDHRVIDGAPAAQFLGIILDLLKNPARNIFGQ